jgi:hypothetical protein
MYTLQSLFVIHLFIWCIVIFGGVLNKTINQLNILILLPLIYIAQSLPFHPIMYMKMKYIKESLSVYRQNNTIKTIELCHEEKEDMNRLSILFNEPYDKILEHYTIYMNNEDNVGKTLRSLRKYCDTRCNKNPFSSQGLIIIGYIINVYAYYIRENF